MPKNSIGRKGKERIALTAAIDAYVNARSAEPAPSEGASHFLMANDHLNAPPPLGQLEPDDAEWERWGELVIDILDDY